MKKPPNKVKHHDVPTVKPMTMRKKTSKQKKSDEEIQLPNDLHSTNPLGLDMTICNDQPKEVMSEWQQEPEGGFIELVEEEDEEEVIEARLGRGSEIAWQLIQVEVPPPLPMLLRDMSGEQARRDPRLQ